jgi:hypothetical protein
MAPDWIDDARRRLLGLRRASGAWSYRPGTAMAVEPSAMAGLALMATDPSADGPGRAVALESARWLASIRRPDGSTGVTVDLPEPGWPTPLALLLWAALGGFEAERASAVRWLLAIRGHVVPRVENDPVGHDGMLVGWPWVPGTHSWVEPTCLALLAMGREGLSGHPRAREGVRVLVDRAIPGGGWNVGNSLVFGTRLRPSPGPSGLALLALAKVDRPSGVVGPQGPPRAPGRPSRDGAGPTAGRPCIREAIAYLREALAGTLAPVSLGWGTLGLRAWGAAPADSRTRLSLAYERASARGVQAVELASLLLAAGERSPDVLGVSPRPEVPPDA